jgi:hypothetical protein
MERLAVFKVEDDTLVLCGYYDNKEDAIAYMQYVMGEITNKMQRQYAGEYLVLPVLYYNLQPTTGK